MKRPMTLLNDVAADCVYSAGGASGGDIRLFSGCNVVNEGSLSCNAAGNGQYRGGSVLIVADSVVNIGSIECNENGSVTIICREYRNSGTISPEPVVGDNC